MSFCVYIDIYAQIYVCIHTYTYMSVYAFLYTYVHSKGIYAVSQSFCGFPLSTFLRCSALLLNVFKFHYYIFTKSKH